ncbi:23S rRNA pseudouridine(955/2504/2580) synthase RluC [Blochmannia endosymbiont of Camponotus (Colobopsis) obliquus]|uniref:23S rRNA pseudouridine(955/2504/2580) synthase RluC n=1 Tax=Blochmannia endosymbiont of Camponotus (Colobopsis) obliquus TaxID=1505597 RepID=UPI00061A5BED|nr:23S rRNA pseudouridine(955/2504/2580) synthase RluC [Blochmannia endosymbiont of Camponotus (Colobopsis) obliquus]AKC60568.1 Ribosomal large subunit pseudouridine synthase C [Blochmannia endosymbiont of Camponotus (Colobopsis) obliquus]
MHIILIATERSGQRIDNFLFSYLKGIPKNLIYRIIRTGKILINQKKISIRYRLQTGDKLFIPDIQPVKPKRSAIFSASHLKKISILNDAILYEDNYILAINKPSGMAVHSGSKLNFGIIEALRFIRPKEEFLELIHRLDRDTSGVLLLAKQRFSLLELHKQFLLRKIEKKYLALVCGQWCSSIKVISVPLFRNIFNRARPCLTYVDLNLGKFAKTKIFIQERFSVATLIMAIPITGRTHQIRAHTQYMGHPIAFDALYGNSLFNKQLKQYGLNRLFLHAFALKFIHPNSGRLINIKAPLDNVLHNFLCVLREGKGIFNN